MIPYDPLKKVLGLLRQNLTLAIAWLLPNKTISLAHISKFDAARVQVKPFHAWHEEAKKVVPLKAL